MAAAVIENPRISVSLFVRQVGLLVELSDRVSHGLYGVLWWVPHEF